MAWTPLVPTFRRFPFVHLSYARWGVALVAVILATGARLLLNPIMGQQLPYITYFVAITLAGLIGGGGPAALALVTSALAAAYFFLPSVLETHHVVGLGAFMVTGAIIAMTCEAMRRAQRRAEQQAALLEERGLALQQQMRQAEHHKHAAHESERRLALALEVSVEGVWDWTIETGHVFYSPRWIESLGYARDDVPPHVSFRQGIVHPDDRDAMRQVLQEHLDGKTAQYEFENRLRMKNGSYRLNLERGKVVEWDAAGRPLRMVGTDTDITERKLAEQALRQSEERLRLAQQVGRIGTFELDLETRVNRWTPELEAIYGLPAGSFPGTQEAWEKLVYVEDRTATLRRVARATETGSFEGEWRVRWPDGQLRWLAGRAWVFKDEAGKPRRLLGVNIDITERKQAEESLRMREAQLQKTVSDLETSRTVLGEKVQELEALHDVVVGRELKMIDLEKELRKLRAELKLSS
jgi:PAS domain S-box-containing protein